MRGNVIETVMGTVVLAVAAFFLFFAYSTTSVRAVTGYDLTAQFDRIDGIREGSDVRISGIKIGSVAGHDLDPKTFLATITLSIDPKIQLPDDTVAEIISSGLLGDKYVALVPGGSEKMLPKGARIKYTQAPVSLENMIGQLIFSNSQSKKPADGNDGGGSPAPSGANSNAPANPGASPPTLMGK